MFVFVACLKKAVVVIIVLSLIFPNGVLCQPALRRRCKDCSYDTSKEVRDSTTWPIYYEGFEDFGPFNRMSGTNSPSLQHKILQLHSQTHGKSDYQSGFNNFFMSSDFRSEPSQPYPVAGVQNKINYARWVVVGDPKNSFEMQKSTPYLNWGLNVPIESKETTYIPYIGTGSLTNIKTFFNHFTRQNLKNLQPKT